jgi:tRNA A-37 threonylcarbamoyl transferase component Bud32
MTERIGRFDVLEKIGEGGMGEVFKARDPQINRIVAIKLLREGFNTGEMRDRFMLEARSAGGLQNPNIVTIFELGEHRGAPFIVMEFLEGDPLDQLIRRRAPLSLLRKIELIEALCSGLGAAHRAGIIHRDVKPPNLMVIQDGMLKILDFGIARMGASERTKIGMLVGTPNYMSPEQLNGGAIDTRTDIFAAGAVCYELLSYERAFPGNQTEAITRILTRDPLSLLKLCPTLEPDIAAVVEKALRKHPRDRYQDIGEMRRDVLKTKDRLKQESPETLFQPVTAETLIGDREPRGPTPASSRMREELRRRAMAEVDAARRLFDQGEIAEALQRLEEFTPANGFVSEALAALQERADEIQREALRASASGRALQAAVEALERGDFEGAVRSADEALLIDERLTRARDVRRQARAALEDQRRYAALLKRVASTIDTARRRFSAGDRRSALETLASFEPAHPEIAAVLDELQAEDAAIETALARGEAEQWMRQEAERVERERAAQLDAERAAAAAARLAQADTATFARDLLLRQVLEFREAESSAAVADPPTMRQPAVTAEEDFAAPSPSFVRRLAIPGAAVLAIGVVAVLYGPWGQQASPIQPSPRSASPPPPIERAAPPPTAPAAAPGPVAPPVPPTVQAPTITAPATSPKPEPTRRPVVPTPSTDRAPAAAVDDTQQRAQRLEATRYLRRAQDFIDAGDTDGAAAEVAKAQKIDPSHPNLPKMTGDIDRLKRLEDARRLKRQGGL